MGNLRWAAVAAATFVLRCATTGGDRPGPDWRPLTTVEQIQRWENTRSLGNGQIAIWANSSPDAAVRARALWALGRMQRPESAPDIVAGLSDPEPRVRQAAAFAAELLATSWLPLSDANQLTVAHALLKREAEEGDETTRVAEITALGRLAVPEATARLVERLSASEATVRATAAVALGVSAKRGVTLPADAVPSLDHLLDATASQPERYGAAYALMQGKLPAARASFLKCLVDASAEVRAVCAKGLKEVAQDSDVGALSKLLSDEDYRVSVEATRALAKLIDRCAEDKPCPASQALGGLHALIEGMVVRDEANGAQPVLALAQEGVGPAGRALLASLRAKVIRARVTVAPALQDDLANLDCRLAAAQDREIALLSEVLTCGSERISLPRRIAMGLREVAKNPDLRRADRWQPLLHYVEHADPTVRLAAVDALAEAHAAAAAPRLEPLVSGADLVLAGAAARALAIFNDTTALPAVAALAAKVPTHPDLAGPVSEALVAFKGPQAESALRKWLDAPHEHVRLAATKALEQITGASVVAVPRESQAPWGTPAPAGASISFQTEKGDFTVRLDVAQTPLTSGNLYGLAKSGFFNGLTFHRVVPDFVVQAGDPRGDGEGGPDYTIRCELSPRPYVRGTLGMALSGKDTGGSQFFVATSPQPHLEGRYTAFGEVVSGMDVVDRLLEGDRILQAVALP